MSSLVDGKDSVDITLFRYHTHMHNNLHLNHKCFDLQHIVTELLFLLVENDHNYYVLSCM